MNLYAYVGNDPINNLDSTGEATIYIGVDIWATGPRDTPAVRVTKPDGTVTEYKGAIGAAGFYISFPTPFGDDKNSRFDVGGLKRPAYTGDSTV